MRSGKACNSVCGRTTLPGNAAADSAKWQWLLSPC